MDNEAIKRLENNHYALSKAFERFRVSIDKREEQEIYATIGETLLWLLTTEEWHRKYNKEYIKIKNQDENGRIIFGLIHAYNSMKHNMSFITIHEEEGGFEFPIEFPLEIFPITVHWINTEEVNEGRPNQLENYKNYIEGREVLKTFNQAISFLNEIKSKFL